jgi:hypothetical protein
MQAYCKCGESEDIYNASFIMHTDKVLFANSCIKNHTLLENLAVYAACIYLGIVTTYKRSVN